MFNVTKDKSKLPYNIIEWNIVKKFKYNDYLAIIMLKILSYIVMVDMWLGKNTRI